MIAAAACARVVAALVLATTPAGRRARAPAPVGAWLEVADEQAEAGGRPPFASFTGEGGVDEAAAPSGRIPRLDVGADDAYLRLDTSRSFSVMASAVLHEPANTAVAISQDGGQSSSFGLGVYAGNFGFMVAGRGGPQASRIAWWPDEMARVDRWVHLVGVYDQPTQQLRLYVNGRRVGWTTAPTWMDADQGYVQIGRALAGGEAAYPWPGLVEEGVVWRVALTDLAISELAEAWRLRTGEEEESE